MPTDDPKARLSVLPSFRQPSPSLSPDPLDPTLSPLPSPSPSPNGGGLDGPSDPSPPSDRPPRTGTSSVGKPSAAETAALAAGLVSLVIAGAAFLVRWRTRARLRRPDEGQLDRMGAPLGAILRRHGDISWLTPDLADLVRFGGALGDYLGDGPLLEGPVYVDEGLPDDLQEEQL